MVSLGLTRSFWKRSMEPVSPVQGVRLSAKPLNIRIKFTEEEARQVSSFYREFYGYDSLGQKTLQGVLQPKFNLEA